MSNGTGPVLVRFENLPPSPTDRHGSLQLTPWITGAAAPSFTL